MTTGQPTISQVSWSALLKMLLVYIALGLLLVFVWQYEPPFAHYIALVVLALFICGFIATLFPPHFRRAARAQKKGDLDSAIAEMEACLAFFQRHPWIDRHRWIVTLNSSAISYREMALLNIAAFQTLARRKEEAKAAYRRVIELFPNSVVGRQALTAIETFEAPSDG